MRHAQLSSRRGIGSTFLPVKPREGTDFWGWVCEWEDDWASDQILALSEILPWVHGSVRSGDLPETQRHAEEGVLQVVSSALDQEDANAG